MRDRVAQLRNIDRLQLLNPLRDALSDRLLSGGGAIREPGLQRGALAVIDAEARRGFRIVGEQLFADPGQELLHRGVGIPGGARGQIGQSDRCTGAYNEIAAARGHRKLSSRGRMGRRRNHTDRAVCYATGMRKIATVCLLLLIATAASADAVDTYLGPKWPTSASRALRLPCSATASRFRCGHSASRTSSSIRR